MEYQALQDLKLQTFASAEAQAAAISDDIAYDAHDIDDGLRAGLFVLDDLRGLPLTGDLLAEIDGRYPGLDPVRATHELMRRVITRLVEDVIREGRREFLTGAYRSADDVRQAGRTLVTFSAGITHADQAIKQFLHPNMYRHPRVLRARYAAAEIVRDLFRRFFADVSLLPPEWRTDLDAAPEATRARRVADYIGGMTDTFALDEHRRLFDTTPELR
jgi:dGTPase